jgi:hypothetical protein
MISCFLLAQRNRSCFLIGSHDRELIYACLAQVTFLVLLLLAAFVVATKTMSKKAHTLCTTLLLYS